MVKSSLDFSHCQAVLFDLDGTLAETAPDLSDTVNLVLSNHGLPTIGEDLQRSFIGGGLRLMFTRALAHLGEPMDKLETFIAEGMETYPAFNGKRAYLYDGVDKALNYLHSKGLKLAVVTNKSGRFTEPLLQALRVREKFSTVICGDTLPKAKPHPDTIIYACEQMGIKPKDSLMIGDSYFDIEAAKNAGARHVCVSYGYTEQAVDTLGAELIIEAIYPFVVAHL